MKTLTLDEAVANTSNLLNTLQFSSYCSNRGYGLSAEQLQKLGFPKELEIEYQKLETVKNN